jgi:phosphatidylglycerol:prolipoprotein diacylglycerol transferase
MPEHLNAYGFLALAGIIITALMWGRFSRDGAGHDLRLTLLYFVGLAGALIGAKVAFLLAEGWRYRHDWLALLSGRSITGGLLGGYLAVEVGKKWLNYPRATGDAFAIVVPVGIALGRVGCLLQGCCPGMACDAAHWWTIADSHGVPRWPAAAVELIFNVVFLAWALLAARCNWTTGNRFHVYLIAYGVFRFVHEFARDDARIPGTPFTGYHIIALCTIIFGALRFAQRARASAVQSSEVRPGFLQPLG